ncbi:MAG: hypothetical protein ACQEVT_04615 [Pseudomonadota bacterium]|uniref:hypothetical protein n=1 Tax=Roseovarius TaxID=74030 RepID=UPI0022A88B4C|nr:hypothetical protein [Roseovarius sp. EGI FJ00037]MCZ0812898.1 hypothetical protein [Roseovarius sp. EGI FJ00037]
MRFVKVISVVSLGVMAGCVSPGPEVVARLGEAPALGGGSYSTGGGITVAADMREYQGRTMVCGVWAKSRQQSILTKMVEPQLLGTGSVSVGDDTVLRGLGFMREVAPAADYGGLEADCVVTGRAWRAGDAQRAPVVRLPRQELVNEADADGGDAGGVIVKFRPDGPGAGTR